MIEFAKLADGTITKLTHPEGGLSNFYFINNAFRLNSVISRTFILLLAQKGPRSFFSGNKIDLRKALKDYNRNEFHHIYPRSSLKMLKKSKIDDSCLANMCFLSRTDNNLISGAPPSDYRKKLDDDIADIEDANFLPDSTWSNDFEKFVEERSVLLTLYAGQLLEGGTARKKKK